MNRGKRTGEALAAEIGRLTGHRFADAARLERAMTHASARKTGGADYERLEFLGDRVLGLVIAELLFGAFPSANEGELSVRLNQLVSAETCAAVAEEIGLHDFIITGAEIKSLAGRKRLNLRADVMESVIATIYLDGGLEAARPFILKHWAGRAKAAGAGRRDPKTALQEWAHRQGGQVPVYVVESRDGPDHDPVFAVSVTVGKRPPEHGAGRSKRAAEQEAATKLLIREGEWEEGQ
ncbi:MAG: ribonuclease III [Zhengella sp.]|uniref:ribonuclease III n=1 Tax=Zhengella sp. TaxID=2282762 RepID=UPI001D496849|nr:ribonuclease III [Notoacmeibacter sp.]MCC0026420.1 ribonuclease III [Brucellaceae bacterium]